MSEQHSFNDFLLVCFCKLNKSPLIYIPFSGNNITNDTVKHDLVQTFHRVISSNLK